ncbi:hypothetical protein D3C76_1305490 [compost metagenome]
MQLSVEQLLLELAQLRVFRCTQFLQADRLPVVGLLDVRTRAQQIQDVDITQLGFCQPVRGQFPVGCVCLVALDIDIEAV